MALSVSSERFAEVYNDTEAFPDVAAVAVELGVSHQTVRNRASVARAQNRIGKPGPKLISRAGVSVRNKDDVDEALSPQDHAEARAENLAREISELVSRSDYPLVNPEAIKVIEHTYKAYSRRTGSYEWREGKPRTWIEGILKVEPIEDYKGKTFIFIGAQNDTPVHKPFLRNLETYAKSLKARIVCGAWTYETSWFNENDPSSREYDQALTKYLCFGQMKIGPNFVFCAEMNTLPTANAPLNDLVTYTRGRWGVFPHAKRQLKTVPTTDPTVQPHQVMTTGAVTRPKVIPRKAGVKSIFHQVIGAVIVEFDKDGDIFCRHISADEETGAFYDLDARVKDGKISRGHRAKTLVFPDVHDAKLGPVNAGALFGFDVHTRRSNVKGCVLDVLKPERAYFHDVFDCEYRNHHHADDPAHRYRQSRRGRESVFEELKRAGGFLKAVQRPWLKTRVVESNHDLALNRYVLEGRFRMDGPNIRLGHQLADALMGHEEGVAAALDRFESPPKFSLFEHGVRKIYAGDVAKIGWIYDGDSERVDGVEHGHHGFRGVNGSRGTVTGFAKIGSKMSIADKHQPEILDGVYVAGASELQMGYNKGPSGWAVSVIVQYQDGKRALVTLQRGKFRA